MPQLPQQWNNSAAQASLAPVASSPEYYIPLWWWSGGVTSSIQGLNGSSSTFLNKGTSGTANPSSSASKYTLGASWPPATKFSLEVWMYSASGGTATAQLWDFTSGAMVASSQITSTSGTPTVVRSSQFLLIPGHVYGVAIGNPNGVHGYFFDASLIVFPQ